MKIFDIFVTLGLSIYILNFMSMKKFLFFLFFLTVLVSAEAQVVISEISYNPPESGTDSLEYIEIYNAGNQPVHLYKYKFSRGVDFTFPDITLGPDQYLLLTVNQAAFMNVYGLQSIQWTSGALSNGGERVTLTDSLNIELVDFTYANTAPWPTSGDGTNGEGRSIELCGPGADANQGANWKVSQNDLMIMLNGRNIFGTPGADNSVAPCEAQPDFIVEVSSNMFTPRDITINVGQSIRWENKGGTHNVNGTLATFPANPEGFGSGAPSGSAWTYDFTFNIPGLYNYQCDPHASLGMTGTVTVIEEVVVDPYPLRTILSLKSVDANGVADSLNLSCRVEGIVYGVNLRPGGLQFTVMDAQGNGFGVFNNSNSLGYTVQEGDRVEVKGVVAQFRGLSQLNADAVTLLAANQPLVNPKEVNGFVESDESGLLWLKNVSFVDKGQWGNGTASGFNVDMTNGQNTFSVRIDSDVDLFSMPVPDGEVFNVIGLLSQFTTTTQPPFAGGYQLLPRYMSDFSKVSSVFNPEILTWKVFPNPANDYILLDNHSKVENIKIYSSQGQLVFEGDRESRILIGEWPKGVYTVLVTNGGKLHSGKFIKL